MYVLNLAEDNRILSAWDVIEGQDYTGMPIVDALPDGDVSDYLYFDGEYIHDPLPKPEPIEPTGDEVTTDDMAEAIMEGVNEV